MTDITKTNIVNRWDKLANADLGTWVSPAASTIKRFFESLFEHDWGGTYWTDSVTSEDWLLACLRGYQWRECLEGSDEMKLTFCLDLHSVVLAERLVEDIDRYLMTECGPYRDDPHTWLWHWQELIRSEMKPVKKRRGRKTV